MPGNLGLIVKSGVAIVTSVAVVSLAPPLLGERASGTAEAKELATDYSLADNGYGYCVKYLPDVDCNCFARTAGQVLDSQQERAFGWTYADPWDLAKSQATQGC